MKKLTSGNAILRIAVLALLAPAAAAFAAQTPDSAAISKLFQQAKEHAALANDDVSYLDANRNSNFAPGMHSLYLQKVKEHAADLFRDYYQLQSLRDKGTPQQREAIDRMEPLLKEMATSLTNTMQTYNAHPSHVNMPPFRNRIHNDWLTINAVYEHLCKCANTKSKI